MEIELRLYGALRRYRPEGTSDSGPLSLEVAEGTTIDGLVERLGIPRSWVHTAFVNGEASKRDRTLGPRDQVALFPPAGGGNSST